MLQEEEKEVYIEKLERIVEGITKILELRDGRIITGDIKANLTAQQKNAKKLLSKLKKGEFEIAVVGLEKAGKSSFTNALIGFVALPTDDQRCTYTSTCIRAGEENAAHVDFYTEEEFRTDFQEKLRILGIRDEHYTIDNLELEKYKQLFAESDENIKKLYEDSLNQDVMDTLINKSQLQEYVGASKRKFLGNDSSFKQFITEPQCAIAVKNVTIYSTALKDLSTSVIYDVPGFNSPTAMHQKQTREKMCDADAIIMVAKADEPSITADVLTIFKEPDEDGTLFSDKLFIFANKADRATDLNKNREVTYTEWIHKRKILPESTKERIVFGSANAHLGEQAPNGLEARKKLEEMGISDGIGDLHQKLLDYYTNARFDVLKKRIDKIFYVITKMFEGISSQFVPSSAPFRASEYNEIILNLRRSLGQEIPEKLQDLKDNVNREAREKHPLTNCISERIGGFTCEEYGIQDDDIEKIHKEIAGIGGAEQPQKLDSKIRERKFEKMYGDFTEAVLECTSSKHEAVCQSIKDIFLDALHMDSSSEKCDEIKEKITALCALNMTEDDVYYQSLIERFARDIFEVQIKFAPGADRLNKFREELANFFSLGVFYNVSNSSNSVDNGTDLSYMEEAPKDSPLWRVLLYPERVSISKTDVMNQFKQISGLKSVGVSIEKSLIQLMNVAGKDTLAILENVLAGIVFSDPEAVIVTELRKNMSKLLGIDSFEDDSYSLLKTILTENRYQNDVAKKHENYDYKKVKDEFSDDILALQLVLQNAFISAVNMDKAFSARESKIIEDVIGLFYNDSGRFDKFIAENIDTIESAKVDEIKKNEAERNLDIAVMNEIQAILSKVTTTVDGI